MAIIRQTLYRSGDDKLVALLNDQVSEPDPDWTGEVAYQVTAFEIELPNAVDLNIRKDGLTQVQGRGLRTTLDLAPDQRFTTARMDWTLALGG